MKTTIELEDDLYMQLKATAALRKKKVRELVAEGVRMVLQLPSREKPSHQSEFPLIRSKRRTPLDIPHDIAFRIEMAEDLERYAASLR